MRPYGLDILRGLLLTLRHFVATYLDDAARLLGRRRDGRHSVSTRGVFTVQYPEERLVLPERFRVLPVLLREEGTGAIRCRACGICTKVCPPQCIWIVQAKGEDGKPQPRPAEFAIEPHICMNCGLCAEHCPFGAIKMDSRFELADYEHKEVLKLEDLLVSTDYYARIKPESWEREKAVRGSRQ